MMAQDDAARETNGGRAGAKRGFRETPLAAVGRQWRLVALCLILGVEGAVLYWRSITPVYAATGRLHVAHRTPHAAGGADMSDRAAVPVTDYMATQAELLGSSGLISEAVGRFDLHLLPSFRDELTRARLDPVRDREEAIFAAARLIRDPLRKSMLNVRQIVRDGNKASEILELKVESFSGEDSRKILESLTAVYVEYNSKRQRSTAREALEFLSKQRAEIEAKAAACEAELFRLRKDEKLISAGADRRVVALDRLGNLQSAQSRLRIDMLEAETYREALAQLRKSGAPPADLLLALTGTAGSGVGPATSVNYGFSNDQSWRALLAAKKMQLEDGLAEAEFDLRKIAGEQSEQTRPYKVAVMRVDSLRGRVSAVDKLEKNMNRTLVDNAVAAADVRVGLATERLAEAERLCAEAQGEAVSQGAAWIRYELREQELRRTNDLLAAVGEKIKAVGMTEDFAAMQVTPIGSVAVDPTPVEPRPVRLVAAGTILGLALGIGLALLRSSRDATVRSPEELALVAGAPLLGAVPRIGWWNRGRAAFTGRRTAADPQSIEAEAFRSIRTAIELGPQTRAAKCLLVTSLDAGDGKSTTCANLAESLAQNGRRVLLLEADLRRPVMHKMLGVDAEPGIADLASGMVDNLIITRPKGRKFDVAVAGAPPRDPAERLSSPAFADFLRRARDNYDRIIIDSIPALAAADAAVLAHLADATLLVVDGRRTDRRALSDTVRVLEFVGARPAGVIVNRARINKARYYPSRRIPGYPAATPSGAAVVATPSPAAVAAAARPHR